MTTYYSSILPTCHNSSSLPVMIIILFDGSHEYLLKLEYCHRLGWHTNLYLGIPHYCAFAFVVSSSCGSPYLST